MLCVSVRCFFLEEEYTVASVITIDTPWNGTLVLKPENYDTCCSTPFKQGSISGLILDSNFLNQLVKYFDDADIKLLIITDKAATKKMRRILRRCSLEMNPRQIQSQQLLIALYTVKKESEELSLLMI